MLGLVFLIVFLIYLLISLGVIAYAARKAKERGIAGWKWGVPVGLVMYLIVFWDHIPTLIAHKYYCKKEAGFFVYKTLEQWKAENSGVAETLQSFGKTLRDMPYQELYPGADEVVSKINERIYYDSEFVNNVAGILPIHKRKSFLADSKDRNRLAEFVYFTSGYGNPMTTGGLAGFKSWLGRDGCDSENMRKAKTEYEGFIKNIIEMGGRK